MLWFGWDVPLKAHSGMQEFSQINLFAGLIIWMDCWVMMTAVTSGGAAGSRWLGTCPWRLYFVPGSSCSLSASWLSWVEQLSSSMSFCPEAPPWPSTMKGQTRTEPLKPWPPNKLFFLQCSYQVFWSKWQKAN